MQVMAAVLPNDIVFIREQGEDEEVDEVGRLPRTAIQDVDVVDERGIHVPEPIHETLEPSQLVFTVLRWSNEGMPDEDRFAFRSPWMAWTAGEASAGGSERLGVATAVCLKKVQGACHCHRHAATRGGSPRDPLGRVRGVQS